MGFLIQTEEGYQTEWNKERKSNENVHEFSLSLPPLCAWEVNKWMIRSTTTQVRIRRHRQCRAFIYYRSRHQVVRRGAFVSSPQKGDLLPIHPRELPVPCRRLRHSVIDIRRERSTVQWVSEKTTEKSGGVQSAQLLINKSEVILILPEQQVINGYFSGGWLNLQSSSLSGE